MMLIQRHYLKEFLKLFAILAAGLSLTFSLFALIQRLDDFMPQDPSLASLAGYALLKLVVYFGNGPSHTNEGLPSILLPYGYYNAQHWHHA